MVLGMPYRHWPLETVSADVDRLRRALGPGLAGGVLTCQARSAARHERPAAWRRPPSNSCRRPRHCGSLCASSSISSGVHFCASSDRRTGRAVSWYNSCASAGGPRRAPSPITRTVRRKAPCGTAMVSPIRTAWLAFLTVTVLTATAPAAQRRAPRERLLTRRANQSHWSSRRPLKRASAPATWQKDVLLLPALAGGGRYPLRVDVAHSG